MAGWTCLLLSALLTVHIGCTLGQVAPHNVDCTGLPAGTRMWGCKAYHECNSDGTTSYVECRWGKVYNEMTGKCERSSDVPTPCGRSYRRECRDYGPPFGKIAVKDFIDPDTGLPCQYFFTCANGYFYGTQKCKGFQVFNELLQYCVKPEDAPRSCNPFGPQVANAREVSRHWWKSRAAGQSVAEVSNKLKQPWWKAKKSQDDVRRSIIQHQHWLTRTAGRNSPKFERMRSGSYKKLQRINPPKTSTKRLWRSRKNKITAKRTTPRKPTTPTKPTTRRKLTTPTKPTTQTKPTTTTIYTTASKVGHPWNYNRNRSSKNLGASDKTIRSYKS